MKRRACSTGVLLGILCAIFAICIMSAVISASAWNAQWQREAIERGYGQWCMNPKEGSKQWAWKDECPEGFIGVATND